MFQRAKMKCKRGLSLALSLMMTAGLCGVNAAAADTGVLDSGKYTVPVKSLTSAAPLQPVNAAFAGAFGENVEITADENGKLTAVVELHHMEVNMGGIYHANVVTVTGAEYLSYTTARSSTTFGDTSKEVTIEVPEKVKFDMPAAEADGTYKIEITVDFMNYLMGRGESYPTKITLTLDFDNALADTTELSELIASCRQLAQENYTEESWALLEQAVTEAEQLVENGAKGAQISAAIANINAANEALEWTAGDYSKVTAAIAKIPADGSVYTKESWDALMAAKAAVVNGLTVEDQDQIDSWAKEIEAKAAALVYAEADYSKVDAALAKVPSDLSKYTAESANAVQTAVKAVVRGMKANEQDKVNKMAADIETAVKGLSEKATSDDSNHNNNTEADDPDKSEATDSKVLDKDNLADGIYNVSVKLWNASSDQASMAASSVSDTARIVVKNGTKTMYIYTKEMTMGTIAASLQEMQVADANGNYSIAEVQSKDASGNPTSFSFTLPHTQEYIKVKVNPMVEMMGNQAIDARLKVDYTTLTAESTNPEDSSVSLTTPAVSSSTGTGSGSSSSTPKTGDALDMNTYMLMLLVSACGLAAVIIAKKRKEA